MATIAIINNATGELFNTVVAELTDFCPEGYRLEVVPDGKYWNGKEFVLFPGIKVTPVEV